MEKLMNNSNKQIYIKNFIQSDKTVWKIERKINKQTSKGSE